MKWYVVRNGEILFTGTENQCVRIIDKDESDNLEMYPEEARIKKEGRNGRKMVCRNGRS